MINRTRILAGTAMALVLSGAQVAAMPLAAPEARTQSFMQLAQAEGGEELTEEELLRRQQEAQEAEEAPAAEEPAAEEPAAEEPAAEEPAAEEPAAEEPAAEEPAAEEPAAEEPPVEEPAVEEPAAEEPAAEEPTAEEPAAEEPAAEEPAAEESAVEEPAAEEPAAEEPAAQEPAAEEPAAEEPAAEVPAAEEPAVEEPAAEEPAAEEPAAEEPAAEEPAVDEPAAEEPAAEEAPADEPAVEEPATEEAPADASDAETLEAPVLDSQKEAVQEGEEAVDPATADERRERREQRQRAAEEAGPPPASDAEAQTLVAPTEIISVTEEEGERVEQTREERREARRERLRERDGVDIVRELEDRVVIQFNNQIIVESDDRDRIVGDAQEVYYEELPRGRIRETIIRPNGVQVVTIRNSYGDIVRRSRILPDGREYVLVYAEYEDREPVWRDPALDLPPLVLTIPVDEYILDAEEVQDPDVYYTFLDQPPVEQVERLYTIDEVKYSARVRDSVRRIDLDTITFEFGSATISESEIPALEGVANAMLRLLEENPAETFLIEGHTDAVGTDEANLVLSDRRAEAVAAALTNVFGIPPENLVTQGYGEEYLKVNTEDPERENRRVAMRRITPLVAPVASAQ